MVDAPETPEALKAQGNELFKERKYVEALRSYDRALDMDASYVPALYNKAMTLMKLNLADEACLTIERGLSIAPDDRNLLKLKEKCDMLLKDIKDPNYFSSKGDDFLMLKRYEDALMAYDKALEIDPDFVPAIANKAKVLERLDRLDEAYDLLTKALNLRPKDGDIRGQHARLERVIERRRMREREPDDPIAIGMKHLGDALMREGKALQAISKYDVAIDREPGYVAAWFNKGQAFRRLKNHMEAQMCFERAKELDPDNEIIDQALESIAREIEEAKSIEASLKESEQVYEDALSKISQMLERTRDIDKDYGRITGLIHEAERAIEAGSKYANMEKPRKMIKAALKMLSEDNYEKAEAFAVGSRKKAIKAAKEGKQKYELAVKEIEYVENTIREMMEAGVGIPEVRELQDKAEEEVFRKNFDKALELAKKAHALALEEAEKALVILKTADKEYAEAQSRLQEAEMGLEDARRYGVVGDLEQLYENARKAFDEGDYISAEVYAKMVIEQSIDQIQRVKSDRESVEEELQKVRDLMAEVEDAGLDLSQAETALERAEAALERGDHKEGRRYAHLAYAATMKLVEETLNDIKIEGGAYKDTLAVIRAAADILKRANEVGDVSELEEALEEAYAALDEDNYFRAMTIATDIMAAAEDYEKERRDLRAHALRRLVAVETAIDRFKRQGINMTDVEATLEGVRGRIDAKEYEAALEMIEEANDQAKRTAEESLRRKIG